MFDDLSDKDFRVAFLEENVSLGVAFQLRALREKREWTQAELAQRIDTSQSVVARMESPDYGKLSVNTLLKLAAAFDVALLVKFVPYTRLIAELDDLSPKALAVSSYEEERQLSESPLVEGSAINAAAPSVNANRKLEIDIPTGGQSPIRNYPWRRQRPPANSALSTAGELPTGEV